MQFRNQKEILIIMKSSIFVWLFAVVLSLPVNGQAAGTNAPGQWTGCYKLRVAPADTAKQLWGKLPRYFELLNKPADGNPLFVRTSNSTNFPFTLWELQGENSANIYWGTGFVGYRLTLTRSGNALTGTVHRSMDYEPDGPLPEFNVDVHHLACKRTTAKVTALPRAAADGR